MESGENFNGVRPGVSCYNAIILNHVRLREWDKVIAVHEAMKEKNIAVTPQTIQGLVLAYSRKGGKAYVTSLLETLRDDGACIDENTFKLLTRVLLPEIEGTLEKVRKRVRDIGESNPQLRGAALDLMRSLRTAEIEEHRRNTKNMLEADFNVRKKEAWRSVLVYFLEFVRQSSEV